MHAGDVPVAVRRQIEMYLQSACDSYSARRHANIVAHAHSGASAGKSSAGASNDSGKLNTSSTHAGVPGLTFAVRSSGTMEDQMGTSFAGQYDTYLHIPPTVDAVGVNNVSIQLLLLAEVYHELALSELTRGICYV